MISFFYECNTWSIYVFTNVFTDSTVHPVCDIPCFELLSSSAHSCFSLKCKKYKKNLPVTLDNNMMYNTTTSNRYYDVDKTYLYFLARRGEQVHKSLPKSANL
jgi:hypothetical protein